jgi:hypothetical protein
MLAGVMCAAVMLSVVPVTMMFGGRGGNGLRRSDKEN